MTYILLAVGLILILIGLYLGLKNIDPKYFVALASGIGLLIAIFGIIGKLYQDVKSSDKQNDILNNTIANLEKSAETIKKVTENLQITQNIDTTTLRIDTTTKETKGISSATGSNVLRLEKQNKELDIKVVENQLTIDNLRKENISLHERITHISKNIFNTMYGGDSYLNINIFQKHNKIANPAFFVGAVVEAGVRNDQAKYPLRNTEVIIKADEEVIYSTTRDFSIGTPYTLMNYNPTTTKDYIIFSITIVASNKNYLQYTIMKKHTDGYWYERRIAFDDLFKTLLRENYFRNGNLYPKELLNQYPSEELIEESFLKGCIDKKSIELRKFFEYKQPK